MKRSVLGVWLGIAAAAFLLLAPAERALAACAPTSPVSGAQVTCTGTTSNQNGTDGYGTIADNGNTITVMSGATVTGTNRGVVFTTGTVINHGTVIGGVSGIGDTNLTHDLTVINYGTITGGPFGGIANTGILNLTNEGTITGGLNTITVFVTNSGTLTGGITMTSAVVNNSGTISDGNGTTSGILGSVAVVSNSGTITGTNSGISVTTLTVSNSGTVSGGFAGIQADVANVTNSGTITGGTSGVEGTSGSLAVGNSGTITGGVIGVRTETGNIVVSNAGTIAGGSTGVGSVHGNVTVVNSGVISGGRVGVNTATGSLAVTNAGTITGAIAAIQAAAGNADTLTLLPGSKIVGAINLGGGGDTVNFRGGNHNLTFDTLAGATVTGTGIFAVSGNQAAAVDPTSFAANGRVLGDFTRSVSLLVPEFGNLPAAMGGAPTAFAALESPGSIFSPAFDAIPGLSAYAADQAVFKAPTVVQADGTAIWARGFGGYRTQNADGVLLGTSNTFYGGAIGIEKQVRYDLRIGAFAGGGTTRSTIELNTGDTNSNLGFGGVYARYFQGASFLYAAVQGGGSQNDTTRNNINNNLLASGVETAKGSYSGWYISPELRLGHNIALGRVMDSQYTLSPSIGVRYLYGSFGGYTETGSTANLTVNSQTVGTLEERAELKFTRTTQFNATTALLIDVTGGALGTQRVGSNTVNAALLGQSIPFAVPGKDDVFGGFGGAGMEWRTGHVSLFASGEYLWLSDSSTVVSGRGGVRVAF